MNNRNSKRFFMLLAIFTLSLSEGISQNPTLERTVEYISKKLKGKCKIEFSKGEIVASYFDADGKAIREDRVGTADLDTSRMGYETKESVFYIPCFSYAEDCVFRKMYSTGNYRPYQRISFVVDNDEKEIESLKKAFLHLIRLTTIKKYKGSMTFE